MLNRRQKRSFTFVVMILLTFSTGLVPAVSEPKQQEAQTSHLSQQLEEIAAGLSRFLADNNTRGMLATQMREFPAVTTIPLSDMLTEAGRQGRRRDSEQLFQLAASLYELETALNNSTMPSARVELMFPEEAQRNQMQSIDRIYVAVAPLEDESEVQSVIAYSNGERLTLDPNEPPDVPTLVVGITETEPEDPAYPLTVLEDPVEEAEPDRIVDDYVGIPQILITSDHEPWYKGDPEIYVHYRRWLFPSGVFQDRRVDLEGVNDEDEWYWLGDPNENYLYLDGRYDSNIEVIIYEADGPDDDDVVGVFIVNWRRLSFGGYTRRTNRDAQLYLDRD